MKRISLRRTLVAAAASFLLLAVACGSSASSSSSPQPGTSVSASFALRVGIISSTPVPIGPEGLAYRNGTLLKGLKSQGVTGITFTAFSNGPNLMAAIAGGSIDIGVLGDTPAVTAAAKGIPDRLVNQSFVGLDTYLYTPKNGVTSIAQLKGKTVATQVGSYMYRYLVSVLNQDGLTRSVTITNIYTTAAVAGLSSGGIAAYAAPVGQLTAVLSKAGFPSIDKASVDHRDLLGTLVTVISDSALAAHPGLPHAWNEVRGQAVATMKSNPSGYYSWASAAGQTPVPALEAAYPLSGYPSAPFTSSGVTLLQGVDSFLLSNKLITTSIDIKSWEVPTP
jgi:NitT/TauT family transport system substrate-binding protein/sulfonate transport system substrate-binding protein